MKLAYFYGWTHDQIMDLDWEWAQAYWLGITVIKAQGALQAMRVSDYPHLKKSDRQKMHKEMHKLAYPVTHRTAKELSPQELNERLRKVLNG